MKRNLLPILGIASLFFVGLPKAADAATTGFNGTGAGPFDYNTTSNWVGGTINGLWDSSLTVTAAQTVTFAADTTLTTGLTFNQAGNFAILLDSSSTTTRNMTLGGNISVATTGGTNANVTIGNATNALNVDLGGVTRTATIAANRTLTLVNVVSNGGLLKSGNGTLVLSGANTYAGGTTVDGGTLTFSSNSTNTGATVTSGNTGTGNLVFNNTSSLSTANNGMTLLVPTLSLNGTLNLAGSQRIKVGYTTLELNGGTRTVNINVNGKAVTGGNTLASEGSGQYGLETQSALGTSTIQNGTLNLQTTVYSSGNYGMFLLGGMSYSGANITVGPNVILGLNGNQGSGANTPIVTISSGGILNLVNSSRTIGLLAGSGTVFNSMVVTGNATATLTLAGTTGSSEFSGLLSNGPAGILALSKTGAGTQILTGSNTYTGNTTISGGTLQIGNGSTTGSLSASSVTTVGTGATLAFNRSDSVVQGTDFYSGNITGAGGITQSGTGTLTLNTANGFTGAMQINSGLVRATTSASALGSGTLALAGGNLTLANDTGLGFNRNTTVSANTTVTSDTLTGVAGVTHTLGTLGIGAQTLSVARGSNVASGTAGLTFGATTLSANGSVFDTATGTLLTLGAISGNFNFTKQGAGQLTLGSTSTRASGSTTLQAGTLRLSVANALGTSSSAALNLNGGTLQLGSDTGITFNGAATVVGSNATVQSDRATSGAGVTHTLGTLSIGANTLAITAGSNVSSGTGGVAFGATTLSGNSTFSVGGGSALSLGALTGAGFTPTFTGSGNVSQTGIWAGTGSLVFDSAYGGTATFNQANTYSGLVVNGGTVKASGGSSTGSNGTITSGALGTGTLTLANNTGVTWGGPAGDRAHEYLPQRKRHIWRWFRSAAHLVSRCLSAGRGDQNSDALRDGHDRKPAYP